MDYKILILLVLPIILFTPAFAQTPAIIITTDSESYVSGDAIVVSGNVGLFQPGTPIIVQIWRDGTTLVDVAQETVAEDGGFSATFRAQGALWSDDGVYTVRASYGVDNISEVTFNFYGDVDLSDIELTPYDVNLPDGGTFDVGFMMKGGTISKIEIIPENFSLLAEISANTNGYLVLELPNEQILSEKMDGSDERFIILIYETDEDEVGIETSYEEIGSTSNTRTIKIPFDVGDKRIEIIGTWAIPEFGAIAGLVLAAAIISIIVLSAKTRLNVIPKF